MFNGTLTIMCSRSLVHKNLLFEVLNMEYEISVKWLDRHSQMHKGSTYCLVRDLQQVQHHCVSSHVLQQPLLLHTTLLSRVTQLTETMQDLLTNTIQLLKHADSWPGHRTSIPWQD